MGRQEHISSTSAAEEQASRPGGQAKQCRVLPALAWHLQAASHLGATLGIDKDQHGLAAGGQLVCRAGQAGRQTAQHVQRWHRTDEFQQASRLKQTASKQADSKQASRQ